jgi:hypothetical protein
MRVPLDPHRGLYFVTHYCAAVKWILKSLEKGMLQLVLGAASQQCLCSSPREIEHLGGALLEWQGAAPDYRSLVGRCKLADAC